MAIVVEVISQLEKYAITKEALEVILFCILNLLYNEKNISNTFIGMLSNIQFCFSNFSGHPIGQTHKRATA